MSHVKVVPEASACLEGHPSHLIPEDHLGICKFNGKDDENYRKVSDVLQAWVRELETPSTMREVGSPAVKPETEKIYALAKSIRALHMWLMHGSMGTSMVPRR